ncbi:MAG TPA: CysB family HTH-type transcriptional regulator [Burkholderiales bacterium]|nr:CysB family HTH-type transcriptional regulator [Burkholderiales bacterium]
MKLQQLRYLCEVARRGLNLSEAAAVLHTSQPGISKQIGLLERELGVDIFVRRGKRLVAVTEPGKTILEIAGRILQDSANLRRVGDEFSREDSGTLTIATTHTQARYALPETIRQFTLRYPKVKLSLMQGNPVQICEYVLGGQADLCIATEAIATYPGLAMLPGYQWNRCVVAPLGHPILKQQPLTLEAIARYPIITYDYAFAGRTTIQRAFANRGITPDVVLTAIDSDVIKTYVELGLGLGILAQMAYDPKLDHGLKSIDASHLFDSSTTRIGIRRDIYLRGYVYEFIELFAPHLTRKTVESAVKGAVGFDYEL